MSSQAPVNLELTPIEKQQLGFHLTANDQSRIAKINAFCAPLAGKIDASKKIIRQTIDEVIQAGKMLNAEQEIFVAKYGPHGGWAQYLSTYFPSVPGRTARHWMSIAERAVLTEQPQVNIDRHVMAQLELFPAKEYIAVEGEATVPQLNSHLTLINNWAKWYRPVMDGKQKFTPQQTTQLRADFKPLYDYLKTLYS